MGGGQKVSLRQEVREALLKVLRAKDSPPQAIASAARTLLEMDTDDATGGGGKSASEMTAEEIDRELVSYSQKQR